MYILKMVLDWTLFDIRNAECSSLVDIDGGRVLVIALALIILVNDHLGFFFLR